MPKTSTPDIEGLQKFSTSKDRDKAQFFVGREEPIKAIEAVCAETLDAARAGENASSVTQLIQGAPGAGKTALLYHLEDRWRAAGPPAPLTVRLQASHFKSEEALVMAIADGIKGESGKARDAEEALRAGDTAYSLSGSLGIPRLLKYLSTSFRGGRVRTVKSAQTGLQRLRELLPPAEWKRPLCLMHDEVQNRDATCKEIMEVLHNGAHGLPLIPLYAGLANSSDVFDDLGLSRLSKESIFTLGQLNKGEASQVVEKMLAHYRVKREGATVDWPAVLEDASDSWPQHLHTAMGGLAKELVRVEGVLSEVDKEAALAEGLRLRQDAYRRRVSPEMRGSRFLLGEVMRTVPADGAAEDEVLDWIKQAHQPEGHTGWQLPEDMTAKNYFDHLVHKGALQIGENDLHACPIPSFQEYLVQRAAN